MAQRTFVDGEVLTATLTNTYLMGEGGAWTSWTPAVTQSGSVTVTNTRSRYARWGRRIEFVCDLAVTGSGTGNNIITVTLPVTSASQHTVFGGGYLFDTSSGIYYPLLTVGGSTTVAHLLDGAVRATPQLGLTGSSFNAALASGDIIRLGGTYEAAS